MNKQRRPPETQRGSWVVRLRVSRIVEVVCQDCTADDARKHPYSFAVDEDETHIEQTDYDVLSVEPNE